MEALAVGFWSRCRQCIRARSWREAAASHRLDELPVTWPPYVCGMAALLSACGGAHRVPAATAAPASAIDQRLIGLTTSAADRIAGASTASPDVPWERLAELADGIGNRIRTRGSDFRRRRDARQFDPRHGNRQLQRRCRRLICGPCWRHISRQERLSS